MSLLAIDPGPEQSGFVVVSEDARLIIERGVLDNDDMLKRVKRWDTRFLAIEKIASLGMAVGASTFDTCIWIGRFQQAWKLPENVIMVLRHEEKTHICGHPRAKDANIRQALIDRYPKKGGGPTPQIGTKKHPGPLYGMTSHTWPALAVAIVAIETKIIQRKRASL